MPDRTRKAVEAPDNKRVILAKHIEHLGQFRGSSFAPDAVSSKCARILPSAVRQAAVRVPSLWSILLRIRLALRGTLRVPWAAEQESSFYPVLELPGGAGRNGMAMIDVMEFSMLFIRCRDGVSHHPDEHVAAEDVVPDVENHS